MPVSSLDSAGLRRIQTLRAGYREGYRKKHEITSKYIGHCKFSW
jgi:hypothetical protein